MSSRQALLVLVVGLIATIAIVALIFYAVKYAENPPTYSFDELPIRLKENGK